LTELIISDGFLADYETSTAVSGIEPFTGWSGHTARTIEVHARPHFDKGSALGQFCRLLVLDANERNSLILLENLDGTDGDLIAALGLADLAPIT